MKKMMIMLVVLCAAVASQAVTVRWGGNLATASFKDLTGGAMTTGLGSETASLFVLYIVESDYNTLTASSTKAAAIAMAKATAAGQTSTSTAAAGRFVQSTSILGSTTGIDYVARVYATIDGTEYYLDNKVGWTTALAGNDTVTENLAWAAGTWGGATGTFGTQNVWVVPEPTSMALLALGVAAIGLRRKNRK